MPHYNNLSQKFYLCIKLCLCLHEIVRVTETGHWRICNKEESIRKPGKSLNGFSIVSCIILSPDRSISNTLGGRNPGHFGPIPVLSGRFCPISGVSHFGRVGAGLLALFHIGGLFQPDFWGESFPPNLFILGKQVR